MHTPAASLHPDNETPVHPAMRILCTADIHIGRQSSRLPRHTAAREARCARAWEAIVALAIREDADVVAIAGDLVDRANRFFEASGPLSRGLTRLVEHGIDVVAVAGNHDFDVLPGLARALSSPRLHLLGVGGKWERLTIERRGERLLVDGWSFPKEHVSTSPLDGYDLGRDDSAPCLGLLHADLDDPRSRYAPVSPSQLLANPHDLWLLGHIHAPRRVGDGRSLAIYPGSPQAMDPGETGAHGVVLVDVRPGRVPVLRDVPLSTVRYDSVSVDLSALTELDDIRGTVSSAIIDAAQGLVREQSELRHLLVRAAITGRTNRHAEVGAALAGLDTEFEVPVGEVTVRVESMSIDVHESFDLEQLATQSSPLGVVARIILDLDREEPGDTVKALLAEAAGVRQQVVGARAYLHVGAIEKGCDAMAIRGAVRRHAYDLLGHYSKQVSR